MTPKEYFSPYIDNLLTIAREIGVEIFNEDTSALSMRQDVIDDINEQTNYETEKYGENAKSYKPLEHDIILWHFLKDKRSIKLESPLDAKYWIVTIDFRFLGFDEYKRKQGEFNLPLCLHPTTLLQSGTAKHSISPVSLDH